MFLKQCKDQGNIDLRQRYLALARSESVEDQKRGKAILKILSGLEEMEDKRTVWVLNSHDRLCLLSQDSWVPPWAVVVEWTNQGFRVEFSEINNPSDSGYKMVAEATQDVSLALIQIRLAMDKAKAIWSIA